MKPNLLYNALLGTDEECCTGVANVDRVNVFFELLAYFIFLWIAIHCILEYIFPIFPRRKKLSNHDHFKHCSLLQTPSSIVTKKKVTSTQYKQKIKSTELDEVEDFLIEDSTIQDFSPFTTLNNYPQSEDNRLIPSPSIKKRKSQKFQKRETNTIVSAIVTQSETSTPSNHYLMNDGKIIFINSNLLFRLDKMLKEKLHHTLTRGKVLYGNKQGQTGIIAKENYIKIKWAKNDPRLFGHNITRNIYELDGIRMKHKDKKITEFLSDIQSKEDLKKILKQVSHQV